MPKRVPDKYEQRRKQILAARGITQYDLAERWGTTQGFVAQLLRGHSRSDEREADLAKLLRVRRSYLFPPHPGRRGDATS